MEFFSSQIQKAIPKSNVFGVLGVAKDWKRDICGRREQYNARCLDLDLSGGELRIDAIRTPTVDDSFDANDRLELHGLDEFKGLGVPVDDDLGDPVVIPKVDKEKIAVIPFAKNPSRELYVRTDVART
jgi:hypothetical protein